MRVKPLEHLMTGKRMCKKGDKMLARNLAGEGRERGKEVAMVRGGKM